VSTDPDAAIIAAAASVAVSLVSLSGTWLTARRGALAAREQGKLAADLEELKSRRAAENDASRARRDYEYEARKRLYAELYPLSFQLQEAAHTACNRVKNLARATRQGHLSPGPENWLTLGDPYYFHSTLYNLLVPLAIHEAMTRRLTQFDLNLDPELRWQRHVAKRAYQCLRSDFDLVDVSRYPPISFNPVDRDQAYDPPEIPVPMADGTLEERWRWRQGLYSGQVAEAVDALLMNETDTKGAVRTRVKSYAEFVRSLGVRDLRAFDPTVEAPVASALRPMVELLRNFHPGRRPVTWRILIAQVCCYRAILGGQGLGQADLSQWTKFALDDTEESKPYVWLDLEGGSELPVDRDQLRSEIAAAFATGKAVLAELAADYAP